MSAIVNDILNVSSLSQTANRISVDLPTTAGASADLHASGLSSANLYYRINSSGAFTLTLPANYSAYKGRVLHIVNGTAAHTVSTAAVTTSSGALYNTAGSATTTFLAGASGNWATLVCDGSTGWYVVASSPNV